MKSVYLPLMTATVACVFIVDMCDSDGINESIIITAVIRRKDSDLYYYTISSYCRCEDQETFMVEERACTKNEDLLKDYNGAHDYKRPGIHMTHGPFELVLYTPHKKEYICHIASLEVARGLNKSFEIDHSGFSLDANGTLTVNKGMLAYNQTEYVGELYYIKLSCAGDENSYFFVVWGKTNVTEPKFNCTIPGTLYDHSIDCPAPRTTTTMIDYSDITTDEQEPIEQSVVVGAGAGMFAVLVLIGLICTCAVVFIYKKRRVKVSAIRSRTLERNSSTMSKKSDAKNEKDVDNEQCIYATPGELVQSNLYGCGGLESNPAYKEPGVSYGRSDDHMEFDDSIIPRHLNPCYEYSNSTEEPMYQEIIPRQTVMLVSRSRMDMEPGITDAQAQAALYKSVEL